MNRFTIGITIAGAGLIGTMIWSEVAAYQSGKALEVFHSNRTILPICGILAFGLVLTISAPFAIYQGFRQKRHLPGVLLTFTLVGAFVTTKLPLPTFFDGYHDALHEIDAQQFYQIATSLRSTPEDDERRSGDPHLPPEVISEFPILTTIFAYKLATNARYTTTPDFVAVYDGSGPAGDRGFRVYQDYTINPYEGKTDYAGSFRKVHPGVYTYIRFY